MPSAESAFRVMYRLGFKPWDTGRVPEQLRDLIEGTEALPPGRALDLGCGTGTQTVYLEQHSWRVTGIDIVPRAVEQARRKAEAAAVHPTLVCGDITHLRDLDIGDDYSLVLDLACFHGLPADQRQQTADGVTDVAASAAIFLLFGFGPGRRGPLPSGIDADEVRRLFGRGWDLQWHRESLDARLPGPLRNAHPTCFCLRRR